jgi:hypothetical protein
MDISFLIEDRPIEYLPYGGGPRNATLFRQHGITTVSQILDKYERLGPGRMQIMHDWLQNEIGMTFTPNINRTIDFLEQKLQTDELETLFGNLFH